MAKLPGKEIQDELPGLRKMVEKSNEAFKDNYKRFNEFRKFAYKTSISEKEKQVNDALGRANIEGNVTTPYISRQCGEYSKQEPGIEVSMDEGSNANPAIIPILEGHIRHIMEDSKKSNTQYNSYRDTLTGGFSVCDVFTEYARRSFNQVLKVRKSKYPTFCGFDNLAKEPHKGDGNYCFEIFPKTKEDFKAEYPHIDLEEIKFNNDPSLGGFAWSFNTGVDDIILLCRLYKKKKIRVKLYYLANNETMEKSEYEDYIKEIQESGQLVQPPKVMKQRWEDDFVIYEYIFMESKVIECNKTKFRYLPKVFFDGDSIDLFDNNKFTIEQFCRPMIFNCKGAQQLKNLGMQALATYLEGMSQHKYAVKKEAIPEEKEYLNALTDPQKANTLVVNAYMDNDPTKPIPDPLIQLQPQACPPEVSNSINLADQIIQNELGSYDAALGINNNQLSGIAIVEAATQSQAAAMPYVVNNLLAWNQIALILLDMIPKYYKLPANIPVMDREGNRSMVPINQNGAITFNYDSNKMQVKVSAGVNFAIQKQRALQQIVELMRASKGFAQFMETKGLKILVDNIEVRGSDILKELADEYLAEVKEQQAQQQQMQQQMMANNPQIMKEKTNAFNAQVNAVSKDKELQLKEEEMELKRETAYANRDAAIARAHAEEVRANMDVKIATMDMHHRHGKETVEVLHKINESERKHDATEKGNEQKDSE